jgi:hypothetical protein
MILLCIQILDGDLTTDEKTKLLKKYGKEQRVVIVPDEAVLEELTLETLFDKP